MDLHYTIVRTSPVYPLFFGVHYKVILFQVYCYEAYGEKKYRISLAHIVYIMCLLCITF